MPVDKLSPGALFASDFRIVRQIGEGGMGAVYVAEQLSTGRERALKLMLPSVVRFNAPAAGHLYAELCDSAETLASRITRMVRAAGLPTTLRDAGVSESILGLLAHEASEQWTARFNPRPVTEADILGIYRAAW